ncbi:MAG: AlpA family transcriptional regulator [Rickettsiales bacterium]|nr:AlpA family transcriptional regulator [Rickettsiales bacterium]
MSKKILRLPQLMSKTGLARSTIYLLLKQGAMPKSINLGQRSVGWLESDIDAWIDSKIQSRS